MSRGESTLRRPGTSKREQGKPPWEEDHKESWDQKQNDEQVSRRRGDQLD